MAMVERGEGERLRPEQRLRERRDFEYLKQQGQRTARGCLVLNWMEWPEGRYSMVGVIASRRIGGAVIRNRARRLLRETFRLNQGKFRVPVKMVLVARASIAGRSQAEVERDFLRALRGSELLKENA